MLLTLTACALLLVTGHGGNQISDAVLRQTDAPAVIVVATPDESEPAAARLDEAKRTPASADAQQPAPDSKEPPTPPHTGLHALGSGLVEDVKHLPSLPNLYLATIGGGLALAVHPLDDDVNESLRAHQDAAGVFFAPGKYLGNTAVQVGAALTVYAVGRMGHKSKASHFGMDLLRAQIVTSGLTAGLKYATHRERPDGSNYQSFPSGHASVTFATATVIERHLGWRSSVLGYTVASYVAASRLHDNRHWLSDVVFGAAVGAIGGRTVTEHGRNVWTLAPVPVPGGVALVALRTGRN